MLICYICEIEKYPAHKIFDDEFCRERKEEFYPSEEFGDKVQVCEEHYQEYIAINKHFGLT